MRNEHPATSLLGAFVFGGLVGFVVGLIAAPKPGHETRDDLRRFTRDARERTREGYAKVREKASETGQKMRHIVNDAGEKIRRVAGSTREKLSRRPNEPTSEDA